jgi:hypothetical protein
MGHGAARQRVADHVDARGLLPDAFRGHAGVLAASHQKQRRHWLARRGRSALDGEARRTSDERPILVSTQKRA